MLDLIIIVVAILVLAFAIKSEVNDHAGVHARKPLSQIYDPEERLRELQFYACFDWENNVVWRSAYISTFIFVLILYFILSQFNVKLNFAFYPLIFLVLFFILFFTSNYKAFHLYRDICFNVRSDCIALKPINAFKFSRSNAVLNSENNIKGDTSQRVK